MINVLLMQGMKGTRPCSPSTLAYTHGKVVFERLLVDRILLILQTQRLQPPTQNRFCPFLSWMGMAPDDFLGAAVLLTLAAACRLRRFVRHRS